MKHINATFNVLAQLIVKGEASDALLERMSSHGIPSTRQLDLFDITPGPQAYAEARAFLECEYDELFLSTDKAMRLIFDWVKAHKGADCTLTCSMKSDGSNVAFKLHITLEDRSTLRIRMEYDMRDLSHPVFLKCACRLQRSNAPYFMSAFEVTEEMHRASTAFLQCAEIFDSYKSAAQCAREIIKEGFVPRLVKLTAGSKDAWTDETFTEFNENGFASSYTIHIASFGQERYEYAAIDKTESLTLRIEDYFKCYHNQKKQEDAELYRMIVEKKAETKTSKPVSIKETGAQKPAEEKPKEKKPSASAKKAEAKKKSKPVQGKAKPSINQSSKEDPRAAILNRPIPISSSMPKEYRKVVLRPTDVIVRLKSSNYDHGNHAVERVDATATILTSYGAKRQREFTAYYCPRCNKYYISPAAYGTLKDVGFICCQVLEQKKTNSEEVVSHGKSHQRHLNEESLLHSYGYNVGQKDSLRREERRMILKFVINEKIMKPKEITSFLKYLIERAERQQPKKNMSSAIASWEDDIRYVKSLGRQ